LLVVHCGGFNHIGHHLWTPTPDPSPQGGGERMHPLKGRVNYAALPASVCTQASPQAFANSRTRRI
jgi:hypothetical protein